MSSSSSSSTNVAEAQAQAQVVSPVPVRAASASLVSPAPASAANASVVTPSPERAANAIVVTPPPRRAASASAVTLPPARRATNASASNEQTHLAHRRLAAHLNLAASARSWWKELETLTWSYRLPAVLVAARYKNDVSERKEEIICTNGGWQEICEYSAEQVVGKAFNQIPGFQGPLTSPNSKLFLAGLMLAERDYEDCIKIVNYCGRYGQPVELELGVHILRWRGQSVAFLCSILSHAKTSPMRWSVAGSAKAAIQALAGAACIARKSIGKKRQGHEAQAVKHELATASESNIIEHNNKGHLPFLWEHLLCNHSEVVVFEEGMVQDDVCAVCFSSWADSEILRKLACGHCFHRCCIDQWFWNQFQKLEEDRSKMALPDSPLSDFSCPLCKQDPLTCETYCRGQSSRMVDDSQKALQIPGSRQPQPTHAIQPAAPSEPGA